VNGVRSAARNMKFLAPGSTEKRGWYGLFPSICLHFVLNVEKMKVFKPWSAELPVCVTLYKLL
jgi:hypothetical protein